MNARATFMDKITEDDVIEAEQSVLSCILASNETLNDCGLEEVDFLDEFHQTVFAAAQRLYSGHQRVNAVYRSSPSSRKTPAKAACRLRSIYRSCRCAAPIRRSPGGSKMTSRPTRACLSLAKLAREAEFAASMAKEGHTLLTLGDEIEQLEQRLKDLRSRFSETTPVKSPGSEYLAAFSASGRRDGVIGVPIGLEEIRRVLSEIGLCRRKPLRPAVLIGLRARRASRSRSSITTSSPVIRFSSSPTISLPINASGR